MKILIVSYAFAPNVGGLERVAETLNQGFLDLGHTIQVITHYLGETQHPYSIFRRPSFQKTYSLARRADIVLFHNMSLQYALPVFLSRRPVICVSHGDYGFVDSNLRGTLLRFFLKCSTNVAVSHYVAGRLPKASTVIRNPFERSKGDSLGFIDRSGDVLFVGRLVRGKGAHILIQAMHAWLSTDVPNLTVVGDGPEMDALQSLVLELGLKRVTFRGSLAKEEVALVMDSHRVLAVPSVTSEGFGMVAVEGIAAGCIPIASDIGG
jgi:glycogen synthase